MKKINQLFPLVAEPHPENYNGCAFLTLVCYNGENFITIIDNIVNGEIVAYVLDHCTKEFDQRPEDSEQAIISVATAWYENNRHKYPVSVEFARHGISDMASKIIRK